MLAFSKKSSQYIYLRNSSNILMRFIKFKLANYTKTKLKREKYSYEQIQEFVKNLMDDEHRNIQNLPTEFHKYYDNLIFLEKPVEPESYECCGKGCCPCIWDKYDNKVKEYQNLIDMLYEEINYE
jgi:hypothetical protein